MIVRIVLETVVIVRKLKRVLLGKSRKTVKCVGAIKIKKRKRKNVMIANVNSRKNGRKRVAKKKVLKKRNKKCVEVRRKGNKFL